MQLSHAFFRFSVCSCDCLPSIAWTRTCTPQVSTRPHRMLCGPVQTPYGLLNNLRSVLQTSMGQIRACRTHKHGCRLDRARLSTGPASTEAHLWKLNMLIFHPRAIWSRTGPTIIETSYKLAARSSAESDQGFRYALNRQTRKQNIFILTAESDQTEFDAHAISLLSCTGSHITVVTYFHNNSLLACVKTNTIKTSNFEAMSDENKQTKMFHLLTMCFIVMDWAVSGNYKEVKAYYFTLPCAIIMLQIQHIEFPLTVITVFNNVTCYNLGISILYSNVPFLETLFVFLGITFYKEWL